jgi:hypothetical protein
MRLTATFDKVVIAAVTVSGQATGSKDHSYKRSLNGSQSPLES